MNAHIQSLTKMNRPVPEIMLYNLYDQCGSDSDFADSLIHLLDTEITLNREALWLLNTGARHGLELNSIQTALLVSLTSHLRHWEAKYNLLGLIPTLKLTSEQCATLESWIRPLVLDPNKFIRGAAYKALYMVIRDDDEKMTIFKSRIDDAVTAEAAHVTEQLTELINEINLQNL